MLLDVFVYKYNRFDILHDNNVTYSRFTLMFYYSEDVPTKCTKNPV